MSAEHMDKGPTENKISRRDFIKFALATMGGLALATHSETANAAERLQASQFEYYTTTTSKGENPDVQIGVVLDRSSGKIAVMQGLVGTETTDAGLNMTLIPATLLTQDGGGYLEEVKKGKAPRGQRTFFAQLPLTIWDDTLIGSENKESLKLEQERLKKLYSQTTNDFFRHEYFPEVEMNGYIAVARLVTTDFYDGRPSRMAIRFAIPGKNGTNITLGGVSLTQIQPEWKHEDVANYPTESTVFGSAKDLKPIVLPIKGPIQFEASDKIKTGVDLFIEQVESGGIYMVDIETGQVVNRETQEPIPDLQLIPEENKLTIESATFAHTIDLKNVESDGRNITFKDPEKNREWEWKWDAEEIREKFNFTREDWINFFQGNYIGEDNKEYPYSIIFNPNSNKEFMTVDELNKELDHKSYTVFNSDGTIIDSATKLMAIDAIQKGAMILQPIGSYTNSKSAIRIAKKLFEENQIAIKVKIHPNPYIFSQVWTSMDIKKYFALPKDKSGKIVCPTMDRPSVYNLRMSPFTLEHERPQDIGIREDKYWMDDIIQRGYQFISIPLFAEK